MSRVNRVPLLENSHQALQHRGDAPVRVERCAVRRIVETSAVLPKPVRVVAAPARNKPASAVRRFAPPLDYAPDGATLEASGGGARLRRAVPPTKWPARAGLLLEASGGGARLRRAVLPTKWPARAGSPLEASGGGARLRRVVPPTKWPARAGSPLEASGGGARLGRAVPLTKWPARAGSPLAVTCSQTWGPPWAPEVPT